MCLCTFGEHEQKQKAIAQRNQTFFIFGYPKYVNRAQLLVYPFTAPLRTCVYERSVVPICNFLPLLKTSHIYDDKTNITLLGRHKDSQRTAAKILLFRQSNWC